MATSALPRRGWLALPSRAAVGDLLGLVPGAAVVALWIAWVHADGGYFPRTWYPSAIGAGALLVVVLAFGPRALPRARAARIALLALAALVTWHFLSMLWADAPGSAWESANKLVTYLAGAWVLSLLPWTARSATFALGAWSAGVAVFFAASLLGVAGEERDLTGYLIRNRYADPLGYYNATAALGSMAVWPALAIAARDRMPGVLQALFMAIAVFVLEFSLLPQSRGAILGVIVMLPVFVALSPNRVRLLLRLLVVGGALALALPPVFDVYSVATEGGPVASTIDDAAKAIWLTTLLAAAAALVLAALERLLPLGERIVRNGSRAVVALTVVALVAGAGVAIANAGRIGDEVSERWEKFKSTEETPETTGLRLGAVYADQRYDYWTVALDLFQEAPFKGVGAGNYERRYNAVRAAPKPSRYAHDLWLRFMAETGVVGLLLFLTYVLAAAVGLVAARRAAAPQVAAVIAACATPAGYFLVHGSFEWIDEFPAIVGPALALPLLALAAAAPPGVAAGSARRRTAARAALAAGLLAAMAVSLVPAWLSVRYGERAVRHASGDPDALEDARRAVDLNPLAALPALREGVLAIEARRPVEARAAFREALDREDHWYAHLELALLAAQEGRQREARRELRLASALSARDPVIEEAREQLAGRRRIDALRFNRAVAGQARSSFTRPRN